MSNIFEKMWDGLKQIIYEFRHLKEVKEKTRKYIDSNMSEMSVKIFKRTIFRRS